MTPHCTKARFTILVSCSDGLSLHSCLLVFLQRQVTKLATGLHCRWSLLRNNKISTNLQRFTSKNGRREDVLRHVAVEHSRDATFDITTSDFMFSEVSLMFDVYATNLMLKTISYCKQ